VAERVLRGLGLVLLSELDLLAAEQLLVLFDVRLDLSEFVKNLVVH